MLKFIALYTIFALNVTCSLNVGVLANLTDKVNIIGDLNILEFMAPKENPVEKSTNEEDTSSVSIEVDIETNNSADANKSKLFLLEILRPSQPVLTDSTITHNRGVIQSVSTVTAERMNVHTEK